MRKMTSIILTIIIANQFLFLAYAATQKGNPDQSDGSVPESNSNQ